MAYAGSADFKPQTIIFCGFVFGGNLYLVGICIWLRFVFGGDSY